MQKYDHKEQVLEPEGESSIKKATLKDQRAQQSEVTSQKVPDFILPPSGLLNLTGDHVAKDLPVGPYLSVASGT